MNRMPTKENSRRDRKAPIFKKRRAKKIINKQKTILKNLNQRRLDITVKFEKR